MPARRVRHHTSDANLEGIRKEGAIKPGRSWDRFPAAVHVETEPFGTTQPFYRDGVPCPKADLGIPVDGAFVEFDAPPTLVEAPGIGPRNTAVIPSTPDEPLFLQGLHPVYVKVRRHWWELWRVKPDSGRRLP